MQPEKIFLGGNTVRQTVANIMPRGVRLQRLGLHPACANAALPEASRGVLQRRTGVADKP
jgi:hypothetical protein